MQRGFILEDLPSAAEWLRQALIAAFPDIEVTAVGDIASARAALRGLEPDIALLDLGLPDGNGLDIIDWLKRERPNCQSVVTTVFADDYHLFPALRAGAVGYLLKEQPQDRIAASLRGIVGGEPPLSPAIARRLLQAFAPVEATGEVEQRLSPRERETLCLIAKGYKLPDVATQLGVTRNTAAGFIKAVYRKLNVSSRAEATLEAARLGLVRANF